MLVQKKAFSGISARWTDPRSLIRFCVTSWPWPDALRVGPVFKSPAEKTTGSYIRSLHVGFSKTWSFQCLVLLTLAWVDASHASHCFGLFLVCHIHSSKCNTTHTHTHTPKLTVYRLQCFLPQVKGKSEERTPEFKREFVMKCHIIIF